MISSQTKAGLFIELHLDLTICGAIGHELTQDKKLKARSHEENGATSKGK